jgi:aspartate/methionine/tyrosine aminotransferase
MSLPTAQRLSRFTESVIREMTRVANRYGAINLSQGFPDFDPPRELVQAAESALQGNYHQYAVTWGQPEFRRALAAKQSRFMGLALDPISFHGASARPGRTFRCDLRRNRGHAGRADDGL